MASKTIAIREDVYEQLKAHKRGDESFSETLDRILQELDSEWRTNAGFLTGEADSFKFSFEFSGLENPNDAVDELADEIDDGPSGMTDVDSDFVKTWTLLIADDVDHRTERQDVSATIAFYDSLADRGVISVFRDTAFTSDLNQIMVEELDVERDDDEVSMLGDLMKEHGLDDTENIDQAASALSRLRRLVLANTSPAS